MKRYWEKFYKKNYSLKIIKQSSPFSKFVLKKIIDYYTIIDLGCGNGRDSVFFHSKGKNVIGIDQSIQAINQNNNKFKQTKLKFLDLDLSKDFEKKLKVKGPKCFYSRFFIHSLKPELIDKHFYHLSKIFKKNDLLFLEYRCFEDKYKKKIFDNHYRNFMKTTDIEKILNKYMLYSSSIEKGVGFAKFRNENPFIARHIVKKI